MDSLVTEHAAAARGGRAMVVKHTAAWGRLPAVPAANEHRLSARSEALPAGAGRSLLAHGLGRSYGDVALNPGGSLLHTRGLDRFIGFDPATGVLRAEAGVSLGAVLALVIPCGWMLPVTPGTRHVTLGGAVANDVHGKNHHVAGSFGHHVRRLELLRSTGERIECGPGAGGDLFRATVAGLGLTGLITWVEVQLMRLGSATLQVENHRFASLDDFWALDARLSPSHPYTVAWLDVRRARGVYSGADADASGPLPAAEPCPPKAAWRVPWTPPVSLVGPTACAAFNAAYYHRPLAAVQRVPMLKHLYPLDAVDAWNRLHGRAGFLQYQCVLPQTDRQSTLAELVRLVRRSGLTSALTVLKTFGDHPAAGMLSFPMPGVTLAMDFANRGETTLRHFRQFDALVAEAGGRLYPAKDAHMSADVFRAGYPALEEFVRWTDPGFSSGFWRRVRP